MQTELEAFAKTDHHISAMTKVAADRDQAFDTRIRSRIRKLDFIPQAFCGPTLKNISGRQVGARGVNLALRDLRSTRGRSSGARALPERAFWTTTSTPASSENPVQSLYSRAGTALRSNLVLVNFRRCRHFSSLPR